MTKNVAIRREVMDLLVMLDKSQAEGRVWTSTPGTVFERDVCDWAIRHGLVETNTIDGEDPVFCITEVGQLAMTRGETPEVADEPPAAKDLHPHIKTLLTLLADALDKNDPWVKTSAIKIGDVAYQHRQAAQVQNLVEARGKTASREYRITDKGLGLIGRTGKVPQSTLTHQERQQLVEDSRDRARAKIQSQIKPVPPLSIQSIESAMPQPPPPSSLQAEETLLEVADAMNVAVEDLRQNIPDQTPTRIPVMSGAGVVARIQLTDDCNDCDACVYREVVELLESRVDGVSELVAGLRAINKRK